MKRTTARETSLMPEAPDVLVITIAHVPRNIDPNETPLHGTRPRTRHYIAALHSIPII